MATGNTDYKYPSPVIADRIQKIFNDNKLTDFKVAAALKCDRKAMFNYRHALTNPSVKFIRYICATYHVDANWLLDIR